MIKKIGVLTSGGDSPGMNAAIRSIVRYGLYNNLEIYGIYDGYLGLFKNNIVKLNYLSVSNIINRGGTFLGSSRFPEFYEKNIRSVAINNINNNNLDALIIIGGDGSYVAAQKLNDMGCNCITIPATIDNDIGGTDYTIGYYTALETVVEAIDRLRDTAFSHQRIFIVEVMGRNCGDLAMFASIAGGCEFVILPEIDFNFTDLICKIKKSIYKWKKHVIIVITENICNSHELAIYIEKETGKESRATVLGHIQRGGNPKAFDRILASRMGSYAVKLLLQGQKRCCIGIKNELLVNNDIIYALNNIKRTFRKDILSSSKKLF